MKDQARDQIEAWRSVAAGWERRRELLWDATRPVSERMVALLDPEPGETILELAAGLGDTGFLAFERLRPDGRLISSDVASQMVDAARRRAAELGVGDVDFRVVDAAAVDLPDRSVDGVLCRFGFMLVPDVEEAFREAARVLRPGGRLVLAVWAPATANEWIGAVGRAALKLGLVEPPDADVPGPFRLSDEGRLRALVADAGLSLGALEDVPLTWRAASLDEWWETTRDTSRALHLLQERITDEQLAAVRREAEERLQRYAADGSVAVPGLARVALASRP